MIYLPTKSRLYAILISLYPRTSKILSPFFRIISIDDIRFLPYLLNQSICVISHIVYLIIFLLFITVSFSPHHFIHNTNIALYDLHDFGADILVHIVGDGDAMLTVTAELDGGVNGLEQ